MPNIDTLIDVHVADNHKLSDWASWKKLIFPPSISNTIFSKKNLHLDTAKHCNFIIVCGDIPRK